MRGQRCEIIFDSYWLGVIIDLKQHTAVLCNWMMF